MNGRGREVLPEGWEGLKVTLGVSGVSPGVLGVPPRVSGVPPGVLGVPARVLGGVGRPSRRAGWCWEVLPDGRERLGGPSGWPAGLEALPKRPGGDGSP